MDLIILMSPSQGGGDQMISTLIMFGAIFAIFYFMIIRPQQKRSKERERMLKELKVGDKVVTSGGIHGTIDSIDDKTCLLKVDDKVKMKFERTAISLVVK